MMWHSILYVVLLVTCVPYALLRGGAPERIGALVAVAATILSGVALARSASVYQTIEFGAFAVDTLALAAFLTMALHADRYWPLLVAGLQADAVIIHLGKMLQPDILPLGYAIGLSIWSYPILIVLAIGTYRHGRRIAAHDVDPAWSLRTALSGSRSNDLADRGKIDGGGPSTRVNQSGRAEALPRASNGGMQ